MAARSDGWGADGGSRLYVRVIHDRTAPASQRADQIERDLHADTNALAAVVATVVPADTGQVAGLRAKTRVDADVWILLSDAPFGSASTELILVPTSGDMDPQGPIGQFINRLALRDIQTANQQRFPAFQYLRANNVPFVLLNQIPWDSPVPPSRDNREEQAVRVRAVAADHAQLKRALSETVDTDVRDRIDDFFREKLAEIGKCADDILPPEINSRARDPKIRQFLISALCVERLAREHSLPDQFDFDFALLGSGLWRAFERAVNLSVVAALRREAGIVTTDPFFADGPNSGKRGRYVVLTDREVRSKSSAPRPHWAAVKGKTKGCKLTGMMLGETQHMLKWAYVTESGDAQHEYIHVHAALAKVIAASSRAAFWHEYVFGVRTIDGLCSSEFICAVGQVHDLRNPPSHINTMSNDDYNTLRTVLLDQGHLARALELIQVLHGTSSARASAT